MKLQRQVRTLQTTVKCFTSQGFIGITVVPDSVNGDQWLAEAGAGDPATYVPAVDRSCLS